MSAKPTLVGTVSVIRAELPDPAFARNFQEGLPILEQVVRWMGRRLGNVAFEDMRSHAHDALLDAARTYDPSRASLSTYVTRKVRWAILDGIKRERRSRRALARATAILCGERLSDDLSASPDDVAFSEDDHVARLDRFLESHAAALALGLVSGSIAPGAGIDTPEDSTSRAEVAHALRHAVDALPERERKLVERHYFDGEDFDEIAADLGISKSWASRLHAQAIQSLGAAMSSL